MPPFSIVEFTVNHTVAVIPHTWFTGEEEDMCYWPPVKNDSLKMKKMVLEPATPTDSWRIYDIRVLGKSG
jgi:hypothetical protein